MAELSADKKIELLNRLSELTREEKLDWREEAPCTFTTSLPHHDMTLSSRDRNNLPPFTLMLQDADARAVVDFIASVGDREPGDPPPPSAGEVNTLLADLYDRVSHKVLNLDESVQSLFDDLGRLQNGEQAE
ncbi:MAG: hypothetical protein LC733_04170 [Actinobacteria bacterium]|nr:hypothetical protein [Actinomycetota bacterium]